MLNYFQCLIAKQEILIKNTQHSNGPWIGTSNYDPEDKYYISSEYFHKFKRLKTLTMNFLRSQRAIIQSKSLSELSALDSDLQYDLEEALNFK